MKKFVIFIVAVILFLVIFVDDGDQDQYLDVYSNTVAMNLDGEKINEYPSKGMYTVDVECENATGTWDYENWKLIISDFTDEELYCNIDFTTISTTYLNDYITEIVNTSQGNGKVIEEDVVYIASYDDAEIISENSYGSTSQYYSDSASSTSGTDTSVWLYSSSEWSIDTENVESDNYYHLSTSILEDGYYQVCYTMGSGHTSNRFYVYVDGSALYLDGTNPFVYASTSDSQSDCYTLGYLSSGTSIRFVDRVYSSSSYEIAELSFYIQKATTINETDSGIRYEGKNPNNYVWFNNELWRIIGVFDDDTHGVSGEALVKIIRENVLDGISWSYNGGNDWSTSSLNLLLNNYYYNQLDGTESGYCYGYTGITANCDYSSSGLSSYYRSMVENVVWYLGGRVNNSATASVFFNNERSEDYIYGNNPSSTTGYIGLMYVSDYGYSVLEESCDRSIELDSYDTSACAGESWLYGKGYEWLITASSSSTIGVFSLSNHGLIYKNLTNIGYAVRPTLYLSGAVYILDGSGTITDPYIIGMS